MNDSPEENSPEGSEDSALPPHIELARRQLEESTRRREERAEQLTNEGVDITPFGRRERGGSEKWEEVARWKKGDVEFLIMKEVHYGFYCGYCKLPKKPLMEKGYRGFVAYVPAPGGITYAQRAPDGFVYGFDLNHSHDHEPDKPGEFEERMRQFHQTKDPGLFFKIKKYPVEWIKEQCELMAAGLKAAAHIEQEYLKADGCVETRAKLIDKFHDYMRAEGFGDYKLDQNFLAMINLLSGEL